MVEIPRGSRNKYEFDAEAKVFRLDRVLSSAVYYNFDYGFTVDTLSGDGDPTDILLLIDELTFTGCHVWARPIGGLEMRDEKGFDFKVRRHKEPSGGRQVRLQFASERSDGSSKMPSSGIRSDGTRWFDHPSGDARRGRHSI